MQFYHRPDSDPLPIDLFVEFTETIVARSLGQPDWRETFATNRQHVSTLFKMPESAGN